ncbi:MAG: hypothetical protein FD138_283, partial [Planctomycetota bacterium]
VEHPANNSAARPPKSSENCKLRTKRERTPRFWERDIITVRAIHQ